MAQNRTVGDSRPIEERERAAIASRRVVRVIAWKFPINGVQFEVHIPMIREYGWAEMRRKVAHNGQFTRVAVLEEYEVRTGQVLNWYSESDVEGVRTIQEWRTEEVVRFAKGSQTPRDGNRAA